MFANRCGNCRHVPCMPPRPEKFKPKPWIYQVLVPLMLKLLHVATVMLRSGLSARAIPSGTKNAEKRLATCNCGQLTLNITGPDPERISLCHCHLCQRQSGNVFAVQARFPKEQVEIHGASTSWKVPKEEADKLEYRNCVSLGGGAIFHFCPQCGSTVWYSADADPARIGVKVGCLTDAAFPAPKLSVVLKSICIRGL